MKFTAKQIAELVQGEIEGNPDITVNKLSKIEEGEVNSISFLSNDAYQKYIYDTNASVVIVNKNLELEKAIKNTCTLIRVEDARICFAQLLEAYQEQKNQYFGISKNAFIADSAIIGKNVYIACGVAIATGVEIGDNVKIFSNCSIETDSKIGNNTIIKPKVVVGYETIIGKNCIIQSGVILGGDGFGFAPNSENQYQKVVHIGNVIIEDHVEIGANTTIDKATIGSTIIKKGVKLDNLIQIAHNVEIGENTVIAAQTGIAGSTKIGKNCMIGGQVGIVGHITIADEVKIAAQSGIGQSITEKGKIMQGSPAFAIGDYKRSYVAYRNLPELQQRLSKLEKELSEIKQTFE